MSVVFCLPPLGGAVAEGRERPEPDLRLRGGAGEARLDGEERVGLGAEYAAWFEYVLTRKQKM